MQKTRERQGLESASVGKQGISKLFLGYGPGVAKTYNMLSEAIRRHAPQVDVYIIRQEH